MVLNNLRWDCPCKCKAGNAKYMLRKKLFITADGDDGYAQLYEEFSPMPYDDAVTRLAILLGREHLFHVNNGFSVAAETVSSPEGKISAMCLYVRGDEGVCHRFEMVECGSKA